ncbi:MAG: hypothetical protein VXW72_03875, partial [Candidatus Thermoplasmatota archaeon]|nr:hypothetical protein [Candidatus Thermoplasmatota archaeon]
MNDVVERVTRALGRGSNVLVEAIPGAGKTYLLRNCHMGKRTLLLAYNSQLASSIQQWIDQSPFRDTLLCVTFHSLCSSCL